MHLDRYDLETDEERLIFEFVSIGPKGKIQKIIQFSSIGQTNLYNLAFGNKSLKTGEIDDKVVTDNSDSQKVLATVVNSVYAFCKHIPEAWIYATGSTPARTRLYQIGLNKYFKTAQDHFEIFGQIHGEWEKFDKGKSYKAFLVRKNPNFDL